MVSKALERKIEVKPGLRLRVREESSQGPALLLLNGSIFNLHQWDRLVAVKEWQKHFRLIRFDYADIGESDPRQELVTLPLLAQELVGLLDSLEIDKAHFYGMSQGTIVGQGMAALAPERVLSLSGYGWYYGGFSQVELALNRIKERVVEFEQFADVWEQPLDKATFERLWAAIYRQAIVGADWSELSVVSKIKDYVLRRVLYPLLAPTPVKRMYDWFEYCVTQLLDEQEWLEQGHRALENTPVLIQHAESDQTLDYGMATELHQQLPNSRLLSYGEGYDHTSIAFNPAQARKVVGQHLEYLQQSQAI